MSRRVRVEGLRALDEALGQMKESTAKGVLRRVGRAALEPFDEAWRPKAPVRQDGPKRTADHLKDTGDVGSKLADKRRPRRESLVEVFAGPGPNPQAVQQEFGNRNHPPQPFVRPAWEATKDQVLDNVATGLGDEIRATTERAAKRAARAASRAGG